MSNETVFVCRPQPGVKIQLEIPQHIFDAYREKAKGTKYTAKQLMENMLKNWIEGVGSK